MCGTQRYPQSVCANPRKFEPRVRVPTQRPDHRDGILQAMAPTAQGMISERCGSPLLSSWEMVIRPLNGYKNGYNQHHPHMDKCGKVN